MRRCIQEEFDVDMFRLITLSINRVLRDLGKAETPQWVK